VAFSIQKLADVDLVAVDFSPIAMRFTVFHVSFVFGTVRPGFSADLLLFCYLAFDYLTDGLLEHVEVLGILVQGGLLFVVLVFQFEPGYGEFFFDVCHGFGDVYFIHFIFALFFALCENSCDEAS
jgi:hypothetical protein